MGTQGRRILPFFDDGNHICPGCRLAIHGIFQVHGGSVFDASCLGTNFGDEGAKQFQHFASFSRGCADRGDHMNHGSHRLKVRKIFLVVDLASTKYATIVEYSGCLK